MLGDPVFLRNRSRFGLKRLRPLARRRSCAPLTAHMRTSHSNSKWRDHAKFDSSMTIIMSGARERCTVAHIIRCFLYNIQLLMRVSGCPTQRSGDEADKVPQAEFGGGASPAWIRCRFFGNEGKNQRPDVFGNSKPGPGRARGAVGTVGWRRGWDSNPRYAYAYSGFRDRHVQPLRHLSDLRAFYSARDQRTGSMALSEPI